MFQEENFAVQKMFLKIRRELVKHSVVYLSTLKRKNCTLGENSLQRNYFIDGKDNAGNFDTHICIDFHEWEKSYMHKKITVRSLLDNSK